LDAGVAAGRTKRLKKAKSHFDPSDVIAKETSVAAKKKLLASANISQQPKKSINVPIALKKEQRNDSSIPARPIVQNFNRNKLMGSIQDGKMVGHQAMKNAKTRDVDRATKVYKEKVIDEPIFPRSTCSSSVSKLGDQVDSHVAVDIGNNNPDDNSVNEDIVLTDLNNYQGHEEEEDLFVDDDEVVYNSQISNEYENAGGIVPSMSGASSTPSTQLAEQQEGSDFNSPDNYGESFAGNNHQFSLDRTESRSPSQHRNNTSVDSERDSTTTNTSVHSGCSLNSCTEIVEVKKELIKVKGMIVNLQSTLDQLLHAKKPGKTQLPPRNFFAEADLPDWCEGYEYPINEVQDAINLNNDLSRDESKQQSLVSVIQVV
jgi:hypothetical protein